MAQSYPLLSPTAASSTEPVSGVVSNAPIPNIELTEGPRYGRWAGQEAVPTRRPAPLHAPGRDDNRTVDQDRKLQHLVDQLYIRSVRITEVELRKWSSLLAKQIVGPNAHALESLIKRVLALQLERAMKERKLTAATQMWSVRGIAFDLLSPVFNVKL